MFFIKFWLCLQNFKNLKNVFITLKLGWRKAKSPNIQHKFTPNVYKFSYWKGRPSRKQNSKLFQDERFFRSLKWASRTLYFIWSEFCDCDGWEFLDRVFLLRLKYSFLEGLSAKKYSFENYSCFSSQEVFGSNIFLFALKDE